MKPPSRKLSRTSEDGQSTSNSGDAQTSTSVRTSMGAAANGARSGTRAASRPATVAAASRARANSAPRRKRSAPVDTGKESDEETGNSDLPSTSTNANHNKYCHFCQHVKVRASSMLACENKECCRRFCEHCLQTHLNEDVDPMSSDAWTIVDGKPFWNCPICRKKCCCSVAQCDENHRHCKAYRYRRRRAELASKRTSASSQASADKRSKKAPASASVSRASSGTKVGQMTPTLSRPTLACGSVRAPSMDPAPFRSGQVMTARPRREATLKRKMYDDEGEEEEEEEEEEDGGEREQEEQEIKTPNAEATAPCTASTATPKHRCAAPALQDLSDMWGGVSHPVVEAYDSDEEHDSMMLLGMCGSMSESLSKADMGMGFGDDLQLDEEHLGSADIDEAVWLRKTHETVYNPVARQRALCALSGDTSASAAKSSGSHHNQQLHETSAWKKAHNIDKQLFPPSSSFDEGVQQQAKPCLSGDVMGMLSSPPKPKAPWMQQGAARQKACTVMYNVV